MATAALKTAVRQIRAKVSANGKVVADRELLEHFVREHDEEAFAVLVERHERLVFSALHKVLSDPADIEDAFQATFLVLVRRSKSIDWHANLGTWLYSVAHRVAVHARSACRRQAHRAKVSAGDRDLTPAGADLPWREACALLNEELDKLADKFRLPLLLCYLEGKSRDEAAAQLGISVGAVKGRLERGRLILKDRLTRRGVALSAGLLAALASQSAAESLPPTLIDATIRAAGGAAPVRVAALASGATAVAVLSKAKLCAVIAVCAVGALSALLGSGPGSPATASAPTAAEGKSTTDTKPSEAKQPSAKADAQAIEIKGVVIKPDGKPAAGAELYLWNDSIKAFADLKPVATAGEDGRFKLEITAKVQAEGAKLVAVAKGFAPDWVSIGANRKDDNINLRLVEADVAVTGRILDLEGRPIQGVTVELRWVGKNPNGPMADWIKRFVDVHEKGAWNNEDGLDIIRPWGLGVPLTAMTDKDGRFKLEGIGNDRMATVLVKSETTEELRLQLMARDGPKGGWVKGPYGLHPIGSEFLAGPCKPIMGVVRDRKTGKPVAGVTVCDQTFRVQSVTDSKGRYRLIGSPKRTEYTIAIGGKKGAPYLDHTIHRIPDTAGLEPIKLDVEVERGIEITGKVIDKATGKPVPGTVMYGYKRTNPNVKDFATLEGPKMIVSEWGKIGRDGSFTVVGIPGPAVLWVLADDSARYPRELRQPDTRGWPVKPVSAIIDIDAVADKPESLRFEIELTPGIVRNGTLTDADGKPLAGTQVVGISDDTAPQKLGTEKFTANGLQTQTERALIFLHKEKKLGAVIGVGGEAENPLTVKLQPLGTLKGRLVDADGKPMGGRVIVVRLVLDSKKFCNLPHEWSNLGGFFNIQPGSWQDFTSRKVTSRDDGTFTIEGLIPGERYDLYAGIGDIVRSQTAQVTHRHERLMVEPGKATDVGDLKGNAKDEE
jgi:RNA polymerase sigma factor (sigma-70 family)